MNFVLLIAAGIIAGASVKRSIGLRRQREAARGWLASATSPATSPVMPTPSIDSHKQIGLVLIVLDRLEQISGLAPSYARRLNENGILTYAEVAELTPPALQSLIAPNGPFDLPVEDWLAQARRLAQEVDAL